MNQSTWYAEEKGLVFLTIVFNESEFPIARDNTFKNLIANHAQGIAFGIILIGFLA